jgi:predicted ATPase
LCGDVDEAESQARLLIEYADKNALELWRAYGHVYEGWVMAERGAAAGLLQFRRMIIALREGGGALGLPVHLGLLAHALGRAGHVDEGLTMIDDALTQIERSEERWCEAELLRIKGVLTLARGGASASSTAEKLFQRSIAIADQQAARSWQLRTATDLAALWQSQGCTAEAHHLLYPIHHSFTEGFSTADLKRAKALLKDLAEKIADGGPAMSPVAP